MYFWTIKTTLNSRHWRIESLKTNAVVQVILALMANIIHVKCQKLFKKHYVMRLFCWDVCQEGDGDGKTTLNLKSVHCKTSWRETLCNVDYSITDVPGDWQYIWGSVYRETRFVKTRHIKSIPVCLYWHHSMLNFNIAFYVAYNI